MFDTIDTAFYYPHRDHVYFFKGSKYIKYRHGHGVVPLSGRIERTIGEDGWKSFPPSFRSDLDAALFYPPNGHAYFFKGANYIKYAPGASVVPLPNGQLVRTLGVDGWTSLPPTFASGVDAALFYAENGHAYFFRGRDYVKFRPGRGVVPLDGRDVRVIGVDGWESFPASFESDLDAAFDYPARGKTYFFHGRDYLRWEPGEGVDARYPRRLGLLHQNHGGWPGLSHVIAGPLVGTVTPNAAALWIWMTDAESAALLRIRLNGVVVAFAPRDPAGAELVGPLDAIDARSCIRVADISSLTPATVYTAQVLLGDEMLDTVTFTTPQAAASTGRLRLAFGSCSDMSKHVDVPAFEAMANTKPDVALFCGDNCYYVAADMATSRAGPKPRDWESVRRMFTRQLFARNHPQFARLSRTTACLSTWDDHDFAHNNAAGTEHTDDWVGRSAAGATFRAMWPNPYALPESEQAIHYTWRAGPVEFFVTDSRFHKNVGAERLWGAAQTTWLVQALETSDAPVKVIVTGGQFLFNKDGQEGHARQAPGERDAVVDRIVAVSPSISGRVLILSGDVHYSELMRLPGDGAVTILEFTSSPLRRAAHGKPPSEKKKGSRIWAARRDGFGVVEFDVQGVSATGVVTGTITLEARRANGSPMSSNGQPCRAVWDLATGVVTS